MGALNKSFCKVFGNSVFKSKQPPIIFFVQLSISMIDRRQLSRIT